MAPPRPLPPLIQRPLSWVAAAFRIRSGWSPGQLERDITTTVDVIQGGIGLATWRSERTNVPLATAFAVTIGPPPGKPDGLARLVRYSCTNNAGALAAVNFFTRLNLVNGGGSDLTFDIVNVAIATTIGWSDLGNGLPFLYVPPGFQVIISGTSAAGAGVIVDVQWAEVPEGCKAW